MSRPLMRIPYTGPLPAPLIIPSSANTLDGAVKAITKFLKDGDREKTVLLTGAGISVASGLADYRGPNGTYMRNKTYRPIYYHEFLASHEFRKRYWARSYLGWTSLHKSKPNPTHFAIRDLHKQGFISSVITQNVDSFHGRAHPSLSTVELHGYLRALVCLSCGQLMARDEFQRKLSELNPVWSEFLQELLLSGALNTEDPEERRKKGYRTNPDGDADVPGAPYNTFRYPACPQCLRRPPVMKDGSKGVVLTDDDGGWSQRSNAGILKPNVIMFGESIPDLVKSQAEAAIDGADKLIVLGSSLATYSAWRLVKKAFDREMSIGILNMGGVRKEADFFPDSRDMQGGAKGFRLSMPTEVVLPEVVKQYADVPIQDSGAI